MDKLLAILLLVAVGCVGCDDRTIYLYSDAAIDAGLGADAETGEAAEDEQEVFITGVGSGGGFAGGAGGTIDADPDSGVADGGEDPPTFSVANPDFIEGVWWLTRQLVAYECDGETLRDEDALGDPQTYDVRIDADHNLYGGIALDNLIWNPGFFEDGVWYPEEISSQRKTWSNPEMRAVGANNMAGTAQYMTGGCSYKDHWSINMVRDL